MTVNLAKHFVPDKTFVNKKEHLKESKTNVDRQQKINKDSDLLDQNNNANKYSDYFKDIIKPNPEILIYEWLAPSRPFKKRKRQYHTTIITISLLLSLILFFAGQVITVAVVMAVAFLAYVMSTIPPHNIKNKITTYGIRTENNLYYWEELGRYWFDKKYEKTILYIEVGRFPHRLTLLLGQANKNEISKILSEVLLREKPPLTSSEKFAEWLKNKIPIDLDS